MSQPAWKINAFEQTPRATTLSRRAEARGVPIALLRQLATQPEVLAAEQPQALATLAGDARVAASLRAQATSALRKVPEPRGRRPAP